MSKKYALALWGGASRGIAHIWVLQYIEEQNIEICEIAGTSMWAIIWAAYALWKTSQEMKEFIAWINFLKLIDINLKDSIVSGNKVYKKLHELYGESCIEDAKIPLKIVATHFYTWEKKVFTSGKIIDAVRASISLPSIFKPFEIWEEKFIDGWLKSNLPVLELVSNDIIAVSVVRERNNPKTHRKILSLNFKKWFLGNTYETLKKTISIIMANNEDLSLQIARYEWKHIVLLTPNVSKYEYFDFMKYNEIIEKGYLEIQGKIE